MYRIEQICIISEKGGGVSKFFVKLYEVDDFLLSMDANLMVGVKGELTY